MRALISLPPAEVLFILKERRLSRTLGTPAGLERAPEDEYATGGGGGGSLGAGCIHKGLPFLHF